MDGTIGEIRLFAGNFAPRNWAFCQGQLLAIASNTALFSILGTTYGGNGQTTFGLPDFRSRVAIGTGQGGGLSEYVLGEMSGTENVTILQTQMPAHMHTLQGTIQTGGPADSSTPTGMYPATSGSDIYAEAPNGGNMAANIVSGQTAVTGGSQPLPILQPFLGMNYIICMYGVYPSRP